MPQDDWMKQWQGAQQADRASAVTAVPERAPGALDPGPLGGFFSSALSTIPEMFGQDATPEAQRFRNEYPVAGVVSELGAALVPYAGMEYAVAKVPALAKRVEKWTELAGKGFGLSKKGITALDNPVAYGAVREMVKFAPFEIGRLGVGLATAPEENYGDLLADVGLSTVLAGGFGGIGGFFRAGGKLLPQQGRVIGADMGLAPTFERRLADAPSAQVTGNMDIADVRQALDTRVLFEKPADNVPNGAKARYITQLEGGNPETDSLVDVLFRADGSKGVKTGLDRRFLAEGSANDAKTLDFGQQQEVLGALGFKDVGDLTSTVRYPRQVTVKSDRAAGTLAKAFDEAPGLQAVAPGVLLGRQADSGLWVVAKRLRSGVAETEGKKGFGQLQVADGDIWFVGMTDKPQRFVGGEHAVAEQTVKAWSKMREAYQPALRDDVFNKGMDEALAAMSPKDPSDMQRLGKKAWTTQMADRLMKKTGLSDSAQAKALADTFYDWFQPTMFKEARNPVFGRLFGLLRGTQLMAGEKVSKIIKGDARFRSTPSAAVRGQMDFVSGFQGHRPVSQLWGELAKEDPRGFQLVVKAAMSQTPAEDLAKLTADGLISKKATETYQALQAINRSVWEEVLPVFKNTDLEGKFQLLDGYVLPRVFKGDWYTQVVDQHGKVQWLATGKNAGAAQAEAKAVLEEAQNRGLKWSIGADYMKGAKHAAELDNLSAINQMVADRIGKSGEAKDVVEAAMKRMDALGQSRGGIGRLRTPTAPKSLTTERTGVRGSADREYSLDDVVKQTEDHYRRIYSFAGQYAWRQRWGQEAMNLSKSDPTLYTDLMRKADQYMGIEGQITNVLNKTLEPVLGKVLGGKPATRIAQATNALMYNWNLAIANPTFAVLNLLQPLQTVLPAIAYITRAPAAEVAAHYHFVPQIDGAGQVRGMAGIMSPIKVLASATKALRDPGPELKSFLERATTDGTLQHSQVDEWVGPQSASASTLRDTFKNQGGWEGIKRLATYGAEKSEQYSRMVSAAAMYQVGKGHFGLEGENLYRFMQRGVHVTNYGYSVVDRSRMFTGPVGSMFGLFKNWQFHYINQMTQYAGLAMRGESFAPLMWQGASALAMGGLGATPLVALADGLARWHSDSPSSFQWLQENWHDSADEIYFGLPAFLGVSLQASSTIPGTDVRNEVANLGNFVFLERAKAVGKAIGTAWDIGSTGDINALRNPNVRDQMLNALAPRAIFRAVSSLEGDYIKSMGTGYPQVRGLGPSTQIMHALGLNQLEVERQQVAARELYEDQTRERAVVQNLGIIYADAMMSGDSGEMQNVIDRAVMASVPLSSVLKSAQTRMKREQEGDLFDRFDADKVMRYTEALGVQR
jgi:hypothetical protein